MNTEYFSIKYITNSGGTWAEKASINGSEDAGPIFFPVSIALTQDSSGNDHLHMVYMLWKLPSEAQVWYAYFDDETWNIADEQLDPDHTSSFLACMPSIVSDTQGNLHVIYSWAPNELNRTLMYLKGFSAASLNK